MFASSFTLSPGDEAANSFTFPLIMAKRAFVGVMSMVSCIDSRMSVRISSSRVMMVVSFSFAGMIQSEICSLEMVQDSFS